MAPMDRLVVGDAPVCVRAYMWFKFLTRWAAARGEDSSWLRAVSVTMVVGSGLVDTLLRTKASGPGNEVKSWEIFVAHDAFLCEKDWLRYGYGLGEEVGKGRGICILPPNSDLSGFRSIGAEAQDQAALTRYVLGLAARGSHMDTITPGDRCAGSHWTEQSSRSTIVAIARARRVPKDATDALGGWASASSPSEVVTKM